MGERVMGAEAAYANRNSGEARARITSSPFDFAAQALLERYGFADCMLEPLCYSENHTYCVTRKNDERLATVRICRPGYRNIDELQAEIAWLLKLHVEVELESVELISPLQAEDGSYVQTVLLPDGQTFHAVAFGYMGGLQPDENDPVALRCLFRRLGTVAAALHARSGSLDQAHALMRPLWDCTTALGPCATWGDWRAFPGLARQDICTLAQAESRVGQTMAAYGKPRDRFGLIHADMRLANLLVEASGPYATLKLLDFDDCAYSWHLFDLAASLSFIESRPDLPLLVSSWLEGYRAASAAGMVRPLLAKDVAVIPSLVMMRRLQLTGWLSTRPDSAPASSMSPTWRDDTVSMALRYLSGNFLVTEE